MFTPHTHAHTLTLILYVCLLIRPGRYEEAETRISLATAASRVNREAFSLPTVQPNILLQETSQVPHAAEARLSAEHDMMQEMPRPAAKARRPAVPEGFGVYVMTVVLDT